MSSKIEVAWQRLLQSVRSLWSKQLSPARRDKAESSPASISKASISKPVLKLPVAPPPLETPPPQSQYRRTPDPAFGSRSTAQRQAYERMLQEKEQEAGRDAAQHSRDRQHRPAPSQTRH